MIEPIKFGGEFGTSVAGVGVLIMMVSKDVLVGVPLHSNFGVRSRFSKK
jgi:hypothetical protein